MRIGRYSVVYYGHIIKKVWNLDKAYELIAHMVECGYDKEGFDITYIDAGFDW